jgi:antitoxin ParD1/3/4
MVVTLTPQLEALIQQKVATGRYRDANAVLSEALELLEERDRHEELRAAIAVGAEAAERGELVDYSPGFLEELRQEAKQLAREGRL